MLTHPPPIEEENALVRTVSVREAREPGSAEMVLDIQAAREDWLRHRQSPPHHQLGSLDISKRTPALSSSERAQSLLQMTCASRMDLAAQYALRRFTCGHLCGLSVMLSRVKAITLASLSIACSQCIAMRLEGEGDNDLMISSPLEECISPLKS